MQDFTLVIPTYNRPKQLQALLTYLAAQQPQCRILILDSSQPEQRHANRQIAGLTNFNLEYVEFSSETHPFDKFREGLHKVTTEFCALCADDDLVMLDGVQRCLDALRSNPSASVAQGYSFSFLCQHNGDMDLGNILYFTPTIDNSTPLARLAKLFARYQAATYGNYRTPVLQRIFDTLKPMRSILARELLGTALAAIEGPMIRVSCFGHGRSMDASENYEHWHPLEWFAKDFARSVLRVPPLSRADGTGGSEFDPTIPSKQRRSGGSSISSTCDTWSGTLPTARLHSLQIKKCPACLSKNIGLSRKSISPSTRPHPLEPPHRPARRAQSNAAFPV